MNSLSKISKMVAVGGLVSLALVSTNTSMADASATNAAIEARVEKILAKMSLEEKIGQMSLRVWGAYDKDKLAQIQQSVRDGRMGGLLTGVTGRIDSDLFDSLQKIALEESPSRIPLLFGYDVIHGYKTIFPIPLGQAASWNSDIVEQGARIASVEATSAGVNWTFAPMVDISRDARWGRIAESLGEDVYLASMLGAAMVRGFQGDDLADPSSMAACVKHYVGYGAAEGGRDYNAVDIAEGSLRDVYLPPFKAALDAGAASVMSSFNELNGIPVTGSRTLLTQVLRDEWGFDGFVVSDWNSVVEMIPHGFARDDRHAAQLAANAGLDFEMNSDAYEKHLSELVADKLVDSKAIDEAVRRMLRIKLRMGLFEHPYTDKTRLGETLSPDFLDSARTAAQQSFVLLKNDDGLLPLSKGQKVAVIGPLAEVPYQQLGTWIYAGDKKDSRTLLPALEEYLGKNNRNIHYARGLAYSRSTDSKMFDEAMVAAKQSDVILFFGGEEAILSGEGHSRGDISLPGAQKELFDKLAALGKPIALIILAGRPISLEGVLPQADAVMMAWHPGTMAGPALVDVLYGEVSPSGRLPVSWPKVSGQIPIYYDHKNTGRPPTDDNYTHIEAIDPKEEFQHAPGNSSNYLDYGHTPEFPFGYGLTYTSFKYSRLRLRSDKISQGDTVEVSIRVKNTGKRKATEIVQLYIQDIVGSFTRPVRQLKAFKRVSLKPGRSTTVKFKLATEQLGFHNQEMKYLTEPGQFNLWIGKDSLDTSHHTTFTIQ